MKLLVILKKTPDTETKINIAADKKSIDWTGAKFIINSYDEFAIEEALKIKGSQGGEVVIASFGPEDTREHIVKGLAMGADRGVLVSNEGLETTDSLTCATVLQKLVEKEKPDLVLAGKQAIDDDNMHVPTMLAEKLDWPHVNVATAVTVAGEKVTVEREVEGGQVEVFEIQGPCVIGAHKSLNTPRYASLPGIMKAKKKPFEILTTGDLGLSKDNLTNLSKTSIRSYDYPPEKPAGKLFQGEEVKKMVADVVKLLRDEAKAL